MMMKKEKQRMAGEKGLFGSAIGNNPMAFGAGNITGPGSERRQAEQVQVGNPRSEGQMMPQDLGAGYLNLAIPGSPLGQMGLLSGINLQNAQLTQDAILAAQNQYNVQYQAMRGQLPVGMMPPQQQKG